MATQLQMRRGTTAQVAAFTGANGEVVVDTEKKTLFVNDGSTAGGLEIARADFSNISASATLTLGTLTATTLNVTTLDLTTLEVTTIKAKDGTSAGSIADSTGVVTIASAVLTTADINAGTVDVSTVTAPTVTASTSLKTPLIEYTDGDDAITIADGGGVTIADLTATSITGTLETAAQTNITSVGTLTGFTSTGIDDNASSNAITIDSSLNIGIGVTSPTSNQGWAKFVEIAGGTSNAVVLDGTDGQESVIGSVDSFYIDVCGHSTATNNNIVFRTSNTDSNYSATEKMRLDSAGVLRLKAGPTSYSTASSEDSFIYHDNSGNTSLRLGSNYAVAGSATHIMNRTTTIASFWGGGGLSFNGDTADANKLDDYEEGDWTPTIGTGTFSASDAHYVKVGRYVKFSCRVNTFNDISTNTSIAIGGLPYAVETNQAAGSVMGIYTDNTDADTVYCNVSETVYFYSLSSAGWDAMTHADLNNSGADFYLEGSYRTT